MEKQCKISVYIGNNTDHADINNTKKVWTERKSIKELIKKMAKNNISLFCLNTINKTDKMCSLFKDIYNTTKLNNTKFIIYKYTNIYLSDIVLLNSVNIYNAQRREKYNDF